MFSSKFRESVLFGPDPLEVFGFQMAGLQAEQFKLQLDANLKTEIVVKASSNHTISRASSAVVARSLRCCSFF
jgi:hypothetical protein